MTQGKQIKIRIQDIHKSFMDKKDKKENPVLNGISLDVAEHEFIVILGPSGCGKSTFLKILGGILPATSGSIEVDGVNYGTELPAKILHQFGFVFQNNNLLQWRTAEGNLRFMLETMHIPKETWAGRVDSMLELVGLQDYKSVYPHELSGGMRQRVGIARALVHDPQVLIMDQPMGALDAITRRMLTFEILNIWRKTQKTVLMVTNNVDEALILANRIFVFSPMPATIMQEMVVDIPFEERNKEIVSSPKFLELRAQMNTMVRTAIAAEVS